MTLEKEYKISSERVYIEKEYESFSIYRNLISSIFWLVTNDGIVLGSFGGEDTNYPIDYKEEF